MRAGVRAALLLVAASASEWFWIRRPACDRAHGPETHARQGRRSPADRSLPPFRSPRCLAGRPLNSPCPKGPVGEREPTPNPKTRHRSAGSRLRSGRARACWRCLEYCRGKRYDMTLSDRPRFGKGRAPLELQPSTTNHRSRPLRIVPASTIFRRRCTASPLVSALVPANE